jgi:hypothetical protein
MLNIRKQLFQNFHQNVWYIDSLRAVEPYRVYEQRYPYLLYVYGVMLDEWNMVMEQW